MQGRNTADRNLRLFAIHIGQSHQGVASGLTLRLAFEIEKGELVNFWVESWGLECQRISYQSIPLQWCRSIGWGAGLDSLWLHSLK